MPSNERVVDWNVGAVGAWLTRNRVDAAIVRDFAAAAVDGAELIHVRMTRHLEAITTAARETQRRKVLTLLRDRLPSHDYLVELAREFCATDPWCDYMRTATDPSKDTPGLFEVAAQAQLLFVPFLKRRRLGLLRPSTAFYWRTLPRAAVLRVLTAPMRWQRCGGTPEPAHHADGTPVIDVYGALRLLRRWEAEGGPHDDEAVARLLAHAVVGHVRDRPPRERAKSVRRLLEAIPASWPAVRLVDVTATVSDPRRAWPLELSAPRDQPRVSLAPVQTIE